MIFNIRLVAVVLASVLFASSSSALNIALSNDDGWDAPGIQALLTAFEGAGHTVTLAGPLDQQSGSGTAVNFVSDLAIKKEAANQYSIALVGGTEGAEPATSALIAIGISKADNGQAPDLLLMGINSGANIGAFTQISGTVGGAIIAISNGFNGSIPAVALSTDEPCDEEDAEPEDLDACVSENAEHYANVASFAVDFIDHLESKPGFLNDVSGLLPPGVGLNINYPPISPEDIQGVTLNVQGRLAVFGGLPLDLEFRCFTCAFIQVGATGFGGISGAGFDPTPDVKDSDATDYNAGFITIVPIEADNTAFGDLQKQFKKVVKDY